MQKTIEQTNEWEAIWKRQGLLDHFIDTGRDIYNWFFRLILSRYLESSSNVLELGSGRASLTLSLAPKIGSLTGVDISETAVEQSTTDAARRGLTNVSFCIDDCTKLVLTDRYDFVWSQGLLEHFEDPHVIASEHYRMLAPGGVALLSVPYKYSYHLIWYTLTRPAFLRFLWPWTEQIFYDKKKLLAIGKAITPHTRTFLLQPFPLGIVFLEMRRPLGD